MSVNELFRPTLVWCTIFLAILAILSYINKYCKGIFLIEILPNSLILILTN